VSVAALPERAQRGLRGPVEEAFAVLVVHRATVDGLCAGCMDLAHFALVPCPSARAALGVVETHGASVWDSLPAAPRDGQGRGEVVSGAAPCCPPDTAAQYRTHGV
jgi:hypothetical protein